MKSSEAGNLLCKSYSYFLLAVACPDLHHEPYIRASPCLIASTGEQSRASVCLCKKHLFILVKCPALNTPCWLDTLVSPVFSQNPGLPEKGRESRQPKMPVLHPFLSQQLGMGMIWVLCWYRLRGAAHGTLDLPLSPPTASSIMWPFPILFMA